MVPIPTGSTRRAHLKTSFLPGSWRLYTCNSSQRDHLGTQAPPGGDVFSIRRRWGSAAHRCGERLDGSRREPEVAGQSGQDMLRCTQETHNEHE